MSMTPRAPVPALLLASALVLAGCDGGADGPPAADPGAGADAAATASRGAVTGVGVTLGPADGADLPGEALHRVGVGDPAPDFTLASLDGEPVTLSDHRGSRTVLLVFYRGHW